MSADGPEELPSHSSDALPSANDRGRPDRVVSPVVPARTFGKALREQRRRRKLSLSHLASSSGMSASYLSRIEHDQLPAPSAKIMHRLAESLNIDVGALQTAAGLIPDRVVAVIRDKPAVLTLLSLIAREPDSDVLLELCDQLLKRSERPN